MRFKSMITLAFAAMVAIALAVPALASANWTKNGEELKAGLQWSKDGAPLSGGSGSIALAGSLGWYGFLGGIECPVNISVRLDPGSTGEVTEFNAEPSGCKMTGVFAAYCQKVAAVNTGLPWNVSATGSGGARRISIPGAAINYKLEGSHEACSSQIPEATVSGEIIATPDSSGSMSNLSISGSGNYFAHNGGKIALYGGANFTSPSPLGVSPTAKYGIIPSDIVSVSGTAGFTSPDGGLTCSVNGTLALKPGTEGQITSLSWSDCKFSGAMVFACGGTSATVTSNSLPWTIVNQGSSIKIEKVALAIKNPSTSCSTVASGELIATPNNASAISSTSLSGTLSTFGANRAWSGSLNWTPAGVYGL